MTSAAQQTGREQRERWRSAHDIAALREFDECVELLEARAPSAEQAAAAASIARMRLQMGTVATDGQLTAAQRELLRSGLRQVQLRRR